MGVTRLHWGPNPILFEGQILRMGDGKILDYLGSEVVRCPHFFLGTGSAV